MAAHHVVGEDLKLGLRIELGRLGEQKRLGHLLAVGLLGVRRDDDLALEDAARLAVEHGLEQLAARAMRHRMLDEQRRVAMLTAAHEQCAGNIEDRAFAGEAREGLAADESRTGRELEGVVARVGADLDERGTEMHGVVRFALDLDVVDRRLGADADLGDGVALEPAQPKTRISFRSASARCRARQERGAGEDRGGLASAVEVNEMDRLVEGDAFADTQRHAARHQGRVEGNDAVVLARIHRAERLFEPGSQASRALRRARRPRRRQI